MSSVLRFSTCSILQKLVLPLRPHKERHALSKHCRASAVMGHCRSYKHFTDDIHTSWQAVIWYTSAALRADALNQLLANSQLADLAVCCGRQPVVVAVKIALLPEMRWSPYFLWDSHSDSGFKSDTDSWTCMIVIVYWVNDEDHRSRIRYLSKKKSRILTNFPKLKKIRKNSYKNSLNARVGVAFQWNSLLICIISNKPTTTLKNLMRFTVSF